MLQWEVLCESIGQEVIKKEWVQDIEQKGREMDADDDETYSSSRVQLEESKSKEANQTLIIDLIETYVDTLITNLSGTVKQQHERLQQAQLAESKLQHQSRHQ